jgi:hypothetical protein
MTAPEAYNYAISAEGIGDKELRTYVFIAAVAKGMRFAARSSVICALEPDNVVQVKGEPEEPLKEGGETVVDLSLH